MDKILVVDDDKILLRFLCEFLEGEGFQVQAADRGAKALRLYFETRPDLVVLDVMMPGMDGWEVCARIRELADTPVILLTAKTSEKDKLRGFRLGVDDYITKPFSLPELAARVRAILARTSAQREKQRAVHRVGPLELDLRKRTALRDGESLDLTPTEFRLLAALAEHAGEALSQDELLTRVWGADRRGGGGVLRRYIARLRRKIEPDPQQPRFLLTIRGFGYRLEG